MPLARVPTKNMQALEIIKQKQREKEMEGALQENEREADFETLKSKTAKLIKQVRLQPLPNESAYSQSFINRERALVKRITDASNLKLK